jgi:membrane fusion protein (multidrug efflux system)
LPPKFELKLVRPAGFQSPTKGPAEPDSIRQYSGVSWLPLNRTSSIVLALAGIVVLASMWGVYTSDGAVKARERDARSANADASGVGESAPTLEVSVGTAALKPTTEIVALAGVLEPLRSTWVAAELAGRIIEVPVEEFTPIESGALLVRLDSALPEAELIRATAAHSLAKSDLDRQQNLGRRSVASEAELDRARAEERRSYASLVEARTQLARTRITAPFDGLVNTLDFDPGAYVQPGTRIAEIVDVSRIELTVLVSDRQIDALRPGVKVRVRVDALGNESFEGRIARVGGAPRDDDQRYPVVVELDNAAGRLRPGMLARAQFEIGTTPAIRLPSGAVLREFELDYVFVLDDQNTVRRVRVSTRPVPFRSDQVEILDGLADGDRVAVSTIVQLHDGLRVLIR